MHAGAVAVGSNSTINIETIKRRADKQITRRKIKKKDREGAAEPGAERAKHTKRRQKETRGEHTEDDDKQGAKVLNWGESLK